MGQLKTFGCCEAERNGWGTFIQNCTLSGIIDKISCSPPCFTKSLVDWSVVLGFTALPDSISVYIGPSPKERETEERKDR